MKQDRNGRDRDGGSTSERTTEDELEATFDVWVRAAQQALRDIARAENHATARKKGQAKPAIQ